jgi:hypothetical protein
MDSPEILRAKVLLKQALADELKARIAKLRKADPQLSLEGAYTKARLADPAFFAHLDRIDSGNWSAPTQTVGKPTVSKASLRHLLKLPQVVHGQKPGNEGQELVMAGFSGSLSPEVWDFFCSEVASFEKEGR